MMLLRARTLAMGMSGVRPVVAEALLALLNAGVTPVVPRYGSVGCSGDLAPLAHIGLALVGEGEVIDGDGAAKPAARRSARRRPQAAEARDQRRALADQRHRRDARHARARVRRRRAAVPDRGRHRRDVGRGPARHRPAVPGAPARDPSAPGPGGERGEPRGAAARLGDRRFAPSFAPRGAGLVLGALQPAGRRRRARHARLRAPHRRGGAVIRRSTTRSSSRADRSSRTATSTASRSPSRRTSWPSPRPRSARSPSGASTACSTRIVRRACRRSSPRSPA